MGACGGAPIGLNNCTKIEIVLLTIIGALTAKFTLTTIGVSTARFTIVLDNILLTASGTIFIHYVSVELCSSFVLSLRYFVLLLLPPTKKAFFLQHLV
jgi:hypothetical protein